MSYSIGDVVSIHVPSYAGREDSLDCVGIIVEKSLTSERTFDPDRRVRVLKYGVMSSRFSRIVFLTDVFLKPLSCMSEK